MLQKAARNRKRSVPPWLIILIPVLFVSCTGKQSSAPNQPVTNAKRGMDMKTAIKLTSPVFPEGGMIPKQYTCDGANISPPLAWSGVPESTKTLALVCDDPDAPGKTWVHWVLYDLPASSKELPEKVLPQQKLTSGGTQGTNDFRKTGYSGPCPPSGTHRYFFRLYAVDTETQLKPDATKEELLEAIEGHIVGQGQLIGKYKR